MYGGGGVFVFFAIGVDPSFIHLSLSALAVSCPARVGRICPLRFIAYARARFVVDFCRGLLSCVCRVAVVAPCPVFCNHSTIRLLIWLVYPFCIWHIHLGGEIARDFLLTSPLECLGNVIILKRFSG